MIYVHLKRLKGYGIACHKRYDIKGSETHNGSEHSHAGYQMNTIIIDLKDIRDVQKQKTSREGYACKIPTQTPKRNKTMASSPSLS